MNMNQMKTKIPTGNTFNPDEFKLLVTCVICGRANKNERCDGCKDLKFDTCEMCDVLLRKGIQTHFSYDIREVKRNVDSFKISKALIREFLTESEPLYPHAFPDTTIHLCSGCKDWEKLMKNKCWNCYRKFKNSKENYKLNGNMCKDCSTLLEIL